MKSQEINLNLLKQPLRADQIEFRIQSINNGSYATILAYKDARCDMNILDSIVGPMRWKREHEFKNDKMYCKVSILSENNEWITKEDVGTQSNTEAVKGEASDAFKRACFNWGIGRELYDYPEIKIKLSDNEVNKKNGKTYASYNLRLKEWTWQNQFDDQGKLVNLVAWDCNRKNRFQFRQPLNNNNNSQRSN